MNSKNSRKSLLSKNYLQSKSFFSCLLFLAYSFFVICLLPLVSGNNDYAEISAFMSVGDWGGTALDEQHTINALSVAKQMIIDNDIQPYDVPYEFVLNTGDNFYYCGIQNVSDYQVKRDFGDSFHDLYLPWYNSLGNHDYGYNVSAQIDLSNYIEFWNMPDRYYHKTITFDKTYPERKMELFVLDTTPCIKDYRENDPHKWDPCGTNFPTCKINSEDDDWFEGKCKFHENVLSQDCEKQFHWFERKITKYTNEDLIVVIGHNPAYEINVDSRYMKLLNETFVDLYLNGHVHLLGAYDLNPYSKTTKFITTGAGSMVNINLKNNTNNKVNLKLDQRLYVWRETIAGFTRHKINWSKREILTEFIDIYGNIKHDISTPF